MIHLLLADDHAMLRQGLRSILEACDDLRVTAEAGSGQEAMERLKQTPCDVVILDLNLPDANGLHLIGRIKTAHPTVKIVVLTMYDHVHYALHALEEGAEGFVVKGASFEELLKSVREVAAGRTYVSSDMASKLLGRVKHGQAKTPLDSLSQREFEVLTMLGRGMSLKQAAAQLGISEKSATTYRARAMEKLSLSNNADIYRFTLESGLAQ